MFKKVTLDSITIKDLDIAKYGIDEIRIPAKERGWSFAVSEDDSEYFTQLISSPSEMGEGIYRYLYFSGEKYCLIEVDAWRTVNVDGEELVKGYIRSTGSLRVEEMDDIRVKINEAMKVVSHKGEGISIARSV